VKKKENRGKVDTNTIGEFIGGEGFVIRRFILVEILMDEDTCYVTD
jgi:hypothetical protein